MVLVQSVKIQSKQRCQLVPQVCTFNLTGSDFRQSHVSLFLQLGMSFQRRSFRLQKGVSVVSVVFKTSTIKVKWPSAKTFVDGFHYIFLAESCATVKSNCRCADCGFHGW